MIFDSGVPPSMRDLVVKSATYVYNRTPFKAIEMQIPIAKLNPKYKVDTDRIKRFGCVAYARIPRNVGIKFGVQALRRCLVDYRQTGYVLYVPEQNKYYESRYVRFVENFTYKDIVKNTDHEIVQTFEIVPEASENSEIASIKNVQLSESEGVSIEPPLERKSGRSKKNQNDNGVYFTLNEELENVEIDYEKSDFAYHALLAKIQNDPQT